MIVQLHASDSSGPRLIEQKHAIQVDLDPNRSGPSVNASRTVAYVSSDPNDRDAARA